MLFGEIIAVYCENKRMKTQCVGRMLSPLMLQQMVSIITALL
jgi:hypothetical protein